MKFLDARERIDTPARNNSIEQEEVTLMQNRLKLGKAAKLAMGMAALAGVLALSSTPVRADGCQKSTAKIDHNLHEAIAHHGPNSPEAARWRNELAAERERCWNANHKWWDEDGHRWHTDRDWDEHDHEH
jgi:hypothetical protein